MVALWLNAISQGAVTLAPGHRYVGPDHGTWVAEQPTRDAYWDQPAIGHLPWLVVHTRGGKAGYVPPTPGQMLAHSLGVDPEALR